MPKKILEKKIVESFRAVGRRKRSSAVATLTSGNGEIIINGHKFEKYFPSSRSQNHFLQPLKITSTFGKYNITIFVSGGGKNGQLDACRLAIARVLVKIDPSFKSELRKNVLLTRDSRKRERRKVGMGGKARRKRQSPKR